MYQNVLCVHLGPYPHRAMLASIVRMEAFYAHLWPDKDKASIQRLATWMKEASLNQMIHSMLAYDFVVIINSSRTFINHGVFVCTQCLC